MLRKVAFCAACLVVRGLEHEACFAVRARGSLNKNRRSRNNVSVPRGDSRNHYAVFTAHREAAASSASAAAAAAAAEAAVPVARRIDSEQKVVIHDTDNQGAIRDIPCVAPTGAKAATPTERDGHLGEAATTACRVVLTSAVSILACSLLAAPMLLVAPPAAQATTDAAARQQIHWFVAPRPSGRVRPPPPEIPPGRITILQWCEQNVGRYLPRLEIQEATETLGKMVISSSGGPTLTIEELGMILRDAVKHNKLADPASKPTAAEEAPVESSTPVPPKSAVQEQIDAVKAELLELQKTPPQQSEVSSEAFSSGDRPSLVGRFSFSLPSLIDERTSVPTDSGGESPPARSARERRDPLKAEKKEKRSQGASYVVDLKAELRAESERAAAASRLPKQIGNVPESPSLRSEDAEMVPPATPYSSPDESPVDGFPLKAFTSGDSERVGFQGSSEGSTSTARSSSEEVEGFSRGPRQMQGVLEQVKGIADKGSRASDASLREVLEQARASLEQLQAEAERISATLGDAAASAAGVGAVTAERLSETFERGGEKLALSAEGTGRVVKDGILAVSKSAAEGLPAIQNRVSVLSSQVAETSARTATRASGAISAEAGELSKRLSDVSIRGPDISNRARSALGELSNAVTRSLEMAIRGASGNYLSGEESEVAIYTAAGLIVVGTAAIAIGVGAEGREREKAGVSGREQGAGLNESEGQVLQPIGTSQEAVAANEGELFGVEAMAATGTLWDMIRESGTGAGDAVREVSEEDLLARAAHVGRKLRETAEGLAILKKEVLALRRSIRESDLEGKAKAFQQELASAFEGSLSSE